MWVGTGLGLRCEPRGFRVPQTLQHSPKVIAAVDTGALLMMSFLCLRPEAARTGLGSDRFKACEYSAHEVPLFTKFSRQEYWSGVPFPSPGYLPDAGIKPGSLILQADSLPSEPPGKPVFCW